MTNYLIIVHIICILIEKKLKREVSVNTVVTVNTDSLIENVILTSQTTVKKI